MSGRKALPNQSKSTVRSRQAVQQSIDLTYLEDADAVLTADVAAIDVRVTANEADIAALEAFDATLGTAALEDIGTSGATVPLLSTANTWTTDQTFSSNIVWGGNIAGTSTGFAGTVGANPTASITTGGYAQFWGSASANPGRAVLGNASQSLVLDGSSGFTYNGSNIAYASANMTWTGSHVFSSGLRGAAGISIGDDTDRYIYGSDTDSIAIRTGSSAAYKYFKFSEEGSFQAPDGSAAEPSLSFLSDTDTGFYRSSSGITVYSQNGTARFSLSDYFYGPSTGSSAVKSAAGSASLPNFTFTGDTDTGMYWNGANDLAFSVAGSQKLRLTANDTYIKGLTTEQQSLYVGHGRSGSGTSGIFLIGDTTYSSWGCALYRDNGGPNSHSWLRHRGTGGMYIDCNEAGSFNVRTNATVRMTIDSAGKTTINGYTAARVASGTATNSGLISWGAAAPGTLAEGQMYLRHA